jgi:Fur family transcriptional regulator, ferric uptake regulator
MPRKAPGDLTPRLFQLDIGHSDIGHCAGAPRPRLDTPPFWLRNFAVSNDAAREKFKTHLATKGLRVTNQRLAIFEAAFAQKDHFTAEELLDHARAIDDSVSRATVYRTLPIMTESALLREVDIGKNLKYYHPNVDNNSQVAQVICTDCDKIFEISAPFMEWYGSSVSSKLGLTPVSQRLQVSAHCNSFRQTGSCKHRN